MRRTTAFLVALLLVLGKAGAVDRVPEEVRLVPQSPADWGLRNLAAAFTSVLGAWNYWYAENIVLVDTVPSDASVDLFYVRANFQKMYVRARSPVRVILPSRVKATTRDAMIVRVGAPGFRTREETYGIGGAPDKLVMALEPLPNALVSLAHGHIGGRTTLTLRTTEEPEFRVMKSRRFAGFNLVLAETASRLESDALPVGGLVRALQATQIGEDLIVRVETRDPDFDVRSRAGYDAIRNEHLFTLDLTELDSRAPSPERIGRELSAAKFALGDPCHERYERVLRDGLEPERIARAFQAPGTVADLYRRQAMRALGRLDRGRVRTVAGERFRTGSPLEFELALQKAAQIDGYLALLGAYARTEEDPATVLRSLIAPDLHPDAFAPLYEAAEDAWRDCRGQR
jgi:hypothetical protein